VTATLLVLLVTATACGAQDSIPGDPLKPGPAGTRTGGIAYSGQLAILESFPVQLAATVIARNASSSAVTLNFPDSCVVLLRAYRGDEVVWDQSQGTACLQMIVTVELAPGESRSFTSRTDAYAILGKDLADGVYRITGYLRPQRGIVEVELGEADLAIPRS
jgi:hypothetical protein